VGLTVGTETSFSKTVGELDVHGYAGLSGDQHPMHVSKTFAGDFPGGRRVAHEALLVALMAAAASRLALQQSEPQLAPLEIDVRFDGRVPIGETVTARARVASAATSRGAVLDVLCEDERHVPVATGSIVMSGLLARDG
jgi:acyl dehydratase